MSFRPTTDREVIKELNERIARLYAFTLPEFGSLPAQALEMRVQAIQLVCRKQSDHNVLKYLEGLGFVRKNIILARETLRLEGKKKYEASIRNACISLDVHYANIRKSHFLTLKKLMNVSFKRSAEKDLLQLSEYLCAIADHISSYRYCDVNVKYREFVRTVLQNIDTERLPPMISALIIEELTELVEAAVSVNVFKYSGSGLTHEEYWRHVDPVEYAEFYEDFSIPEETVLIEDMDAYSRHEAIAEQSLWYGVDVTVDDFIISSAGGLLNIRLQGNP